MKARSALIALSLAANAALIGFFIANAHRLVGPGSGPARVAAAGGPAGSDLPFGNWRRFSSADLRSQVAQLSAAGVPTQIAQGLIRAELDQGYNARRRDLLARFPRGNYWEPSFARFNSNVLVGLSAIQELESAQLRNLFGPQADTLASDTGRFMPPMFNLRAQAEALPPEKFQKVAAIILDYTSMRASMTGSASGLVDANDGARREYLSKQQKADIEAALSPDELLEYNLRTSIEANSLRYTLSDFNPTEGEFRAIYKAQADFNGRYSSEAGLAPGEVQSARDAHKEELDAQLQQTLGAERYAQYKVETQPDYGITSKVADALGLPAGSTQRILDVEADISKRVGAIRNDRNVTENERSAQLAALADEARARLSPVLGDKGLELYKANAGYWLTSLTPAR